MRVAALMCLAIVLAASVQVAASAASSAPVTVTATVAPRITSTFADGAVIIAANTSWQVTADVPGGGRFTAVGDPTAGQRVVLPEGATGIDVCMY